jgi:hypothetical protein
MTVSWYSISISLPVIGSIIFNAYFCVDDTTNVIQNFYYVNNNKYEDILLRELGDYGSDNVFIENKFSTGGTNILSVIPFINTNFNNPYKLNLYSFTSIVEDITVITNVLGYNPTNTYNENWNDAFPIINSFTSIPGLPELPVPRPIISMGSLFSNNAQVYYKPHSLSVGGGGSGVRNARIKKRKT